MGWYVVGERRRGFEDLWKAESIDISVWVRESLIGME